MQMMMNSAMQQDHDVPAMPALCRDCLTPFDAGPRCPGCGSPRVIAHPELFDLSIAHMDCDAFYARSRSATTPSSRQARHHRRRQARRGLHRLLRRPHPRRALGHADVQGPEALPRRRGDRPGWTTTPRSRNQIRAMMDELTPAVEPLSLDEAFLDLTGTERLHGAPPAVMLAGLVKRMEGRARPVTGSIGLSHNKFLAKVASDLDKPRGSP
jgi:DNA polymerase-4